MSEPTRHPPRTAPIVDRRGFLVATAAVGAAAIARPSFAAVAKREKTRIALVGCGRQGHNSMRFTTDWFETVAVCDVDEGRRERSKELLTGSKGDAYNDYRAILDRDDIQVLYIATPDHWRTKILIEAMRAGKDVYAEKPLTLTVAEGEQVLAVQKQTGRVVQVGTQQRSKFEHFTTAIALVQSGRLGKIKRIQAAIGSGVGCGPLPTATPPKGLDWDRWLGPAPYTDYRTDRTVPIDTSSDGEDFWKQVGHNNCFNNFRWWHQYSGGKLTDWGAHHVDIACWALEANGQSNDAVRISGMAKLPTPHQDGYPVHDDRYNMPHAYMLTVEMAGGVELVVRHDTDNGVLIEGEKGRIFVNRGKIVGKPINELKENPLPEDALDKAYRGMARKHTYHKAHWHNFYSCLEDRREPISDMTSHLKALDICHKLNIAARLGDGKQARTLDLDLKTGKVIGDDQANAMFSRENRKGYEIEA